MTATDMNKVPLRNWCFTCFNASAEDEAKVLALAPLAVRITVGREKCPTTGTPHLQGYIRFLKSHRFSWVKDHLPAGSHIEPRKGLESQASQYCLKDGDVLIDQGVDADRGKGVKRTRDEEVEEVIEEIEKGEKYGAIRNRHRKFFFWYRRHVVDYMHDHARLQADPDFVPPHPEHRL